MVLDPISSLGVASGALAFVEFGYKMCKAAREIYRSESGALTVQQERKNMILDLQSLMANLQPADEDVKDLSKNEVAIRKIAESCSEQASKLMSILKDLEVDPARKHRSKISKSFMNIWKEKEIMQMEKKLDSSRSQLTLGLIAVLSNQQSALMKSLKEIEIHHQEEQIRGADEVSLFCDRLKTSLMADGHNTSRRADLNAVIAQIDGLAAEATKQYKIQRVLKSLKYRSMRERDEAIKEAFAKTFNWIFEDYHKATGNPVHFNKWLRDGKGVFWIRGKPGSGKSTLIKYICGDPRVASLLHEWADQSPLVTAKFFFWYSGTPMQKSQQGLLQSILYEVLRQCPNAIEIVTPFRWLHARPFDEPEPWTRLELLKAIEDITERQVPNAKFCFFVDGLDEYEGDHDEIISVIQRFAALSNVKFCVASRPWNVFDKAFQAEEQSSEINSLLLQDFTKDDMRLYVRETLELDPDFTRFSSQDISYHALLDDLVDRANGVFLWVYLAVTSLKRGLTNRDTMTHLRKRLEDFPPTLEDYFRRMLNSVDMVYRRSTSQMLLITLCAKHPLHLWLYGYLDEFDQNPGTPAMLRQPNKTQLLSDLENAKKRVNAQCQDLLEVHVNETDKYGQTVEFMHRTVRDFLTTRAIQELLWDRLEAPFNPNSWLCRAMLMQIKTFAPLYVDSETGVVNGADSLDHVPSHIFEYAKEAEIDNNCSEHEVMDETEAICEKLGLAEKDHMINLALILQMPCYVMYRLSKNDNLLKSVGSEEAPALVIVFNYPVDVTDVYKYGYDYVNVAMVKLLLANGADPNQRYRHTSVWGYLLEKIHLDDAAKREPRMWFEVVEAMVRAGANCKLRVRPQEADASNNNMTTDDTHITMSEVIEGKFPAEYVEELKPLMQPNLTSRIKGLLGYF